MARPPETATTRAPRILPDQQEEQTMTPNERETPPAAAGGPETPPAAGAAAGAARQAAPAAAPAAGTLLAAFSDQLAQAVEVVSESVVRVDARRRQPASGVVWTAAEAS